MSAIIEWLAGHALAGGTFAAGIAGLLFAVRTILKQDRTIAAKDTEIAEHKLRTETQARVNDMILTHASAREEEIKAQSERLVKAQIASDLTEDLKKPPVTDEQWAVEAKDLLDESKKPKP